eukprot:Nitzschia sp. Nitz4//scaffold55_size114948//55103//55909//NITZ4_003900-RA/size114948-processed-gene-0.67-mRNA-1//-1//CDS//3329554527//3918//frame0
MRLSAELLGSSEQRTNALGEREIVLRGLAIPAIEHLAVTRDAFDTIDFTDNRITILENFPRLSRLSSLLLSSNVIESIDHQNLAKNIPQLMYLDLGHNRIGSLLQVANLGKACTKLEFLNLRGNPVTHRQHYRLYAVQSIPSLKVLDFVRISKTERERAERLANSAAGAALEADVQGERQTPGAAKTFVPGEGQSAEESFKASFTPEEKLQIRELVAQAASPAEIEEIERYVQRGVLPPALANRKRPPADDTTDQDPSAKKSRIDASS